MWRSILVADATLLDDVVKFDIEQLHSEMIACQFMSEPSNSILQKESLLSYWHMIN